MNKHEVEYNNEKYELTDEQYSELKSAIELIKKPIGQNSLTLIRMI